MDYTEYSQIKTAIMTTCSCTEEKVQAILNRVVALGGDIRKWATELVEIMEAAHPTAEDVIASLDKYADDNGKRDAGYGSFKLPPGYMNHDARRRAAKAEAKKRKKNAHRDTRRR